MTVTTAPAAPAAPAAAVPAPRPLDADPGPSDVTALRTEVDALDAQVIVLLQQRLELSRRIQALRVAGGGPRVQHAREAEVLRAWQDGLGASGATIALEVLALCRGRLG